MASESSTSSRRSCVESSIALKEPLEQLQEQEPEEDSYQPEATPKEPLEQWQEEVKPKEPQGGEEIVKEVYVCTRVCKGVVPYFGVVITYTFIQKISVYIRDDCGYHSSTATAYANQVILCFAAWIGFCFASAPQLGGSTRWEMCKQRFFEQQWWVYILALLYGICETLSILALSYTSVAESVALKNFETLFIALLSGGGLASACLGEQFQAFKQKYNARSLFLLFLVVVGAILTVFYNKHERRPYWRRQDPLIGNVLSVGVAFCAGLYMVLFKQAFGRKDRALDFTMSELMFFIAFRATIAVLFGWIFIFIFNTHGVDYASWPSQSAFMWICVRSTVSAAFTVLLSCTILQHNPLTAQLAMMLALPCTFLWDLLVHGSFGFRKCFGSVLIIVGVVGFECVHRGVGFSSFVPAYLSESRSLLRSRTADASARDEQVTRMEIDAVGASASEEHVTKTSTH